jgi:hypothetical protein
MSPDPPPVVGTDATWVAHVQARSNEAEVADLAPLVVDKCGTSGVETGAAGVGGHSGAVVALGEVS